MKRPVTESNPRLRGTAKALAFLRAMVASGAYEGARYLPSMRDLATEAGVGLVAMWKAVNALKTEGSLAGDRRHRTTVPPSDALEPRDQILSVRSFDATRTTKQWERVSRRLSSDILTGRFTPGEPLPRRKELCHFYSTSMPTLRKALIALETDGHIVSRKRGYMVPPPVSHRAGSRIIVYLPGNSKEGIFVVPWYEQVLRHMEMMCAQSSVTIEVVMYSQDDGTLRISRPGGLERYRIDHERGILGAIYVVLRPHLFVNLIVPTLRIGKYPTVFCDETGVLKLPPAIRFDRFSRVFTYEASSERAGAAAGRLLLAHGHNTIAYISPVHQAPWSHARLDGLRKVYSDACLPDGVVACTLDRFSETWQLRHAGMVRCGFEHVQQAILNWQSKAPEQFRGSLNRALQALADAVCVPGELMCQFGPLLERTLANPQVTAWVVSSDQTAYVVRDYLKARGIRVPQDLSVVSFDNQPESLRCRLTSYDFNAYALASAAYSFINRIPWGTLDRRRGIQIQIKGSFVVRESLGPARQNGRSVLSKE